MLAAFTSGILFCLFIFQLVLYLKNRRAWIWLLLSLLDLMLAGLLASGLLFASDAEFRFKIPLLIVILFFSLAEILLLIRQILLHMKEKDILETSIKLLDNSFEGKVKERTKQLEAIRDSVSEYAVQKFELVQELETKNHEINMQKDDIIKSNEKLQRAYDEIKRLDDFKNKMTRMIIHDLKNPLNILLNIIDTWDVPVKQASTVKHISMDMLDLVMNILDVNKFEESKMKVETGIFSLNKLLGKIIDNMSVLIIKLSLNLKTDIPNNCVLNADEHLVARIFENLISNSIKFTPAGGSIQITASEEKGQIRIEVKDNGIGIQEEMLNHVFDEYTHSSGLSKFYGSSTGIGLTYCRLAVEAMEGRIGLSSDIGKGTVVWFILPGKVEGDGKIHVGELNSSIEIRPKLPHLTKEEQILIKPLLEQIKSTDVYEVSTILNLLSNDLFNKSGRLQIWKEAIETAAFEADKGFFEKI